MRELIKRYHPAVLWNDIDYPKSGHPLQIMAEYYNTVPDGVIDDRFGVKHSDFKSPEYQTMDKISETKWEECRGLGRSFGYNRAEGEAETIAPDELIYLLADIVSKNGNLLLDVGPEAPRNNSPQPRPSTPGIGPTACSATQEWCQGRCVDSITFVNDTNNCGRCGNHCSFSETCRGGFCACGPGYENCMGRCMSSASFTSDSQNCGRCGNSCP